MVLSPVSRCVESARSRSASASIPIASSVSQAAASATAPITFGEPASKRSGASAQTTSSSVTSLIAPPPCSSGSPPSGDLADERTGAERRVELVAGDREVVDPRLGHRQRAVRRELGGVDEQLRAVRVGELREFLERPDLTGHVRGAGDGEQVDRRRAQRLRRDLEQLVGRGRERQHVQVVAAPGEHVRVVLDRGREHPRARRKGGGEDVDRLGRVANEHDAAPPARPRSARRPRARARRRRSRPATSRRCRGARCCTTARRPRRRPRRRPSPACSPRSRG